MKCCTEAAALLAKSKLIIPGAIVVLESGEEEIDLSADKRLSDYEVIKSTSYGKKTSVNILLYRGSEDEQ